LGCVVLGFAGWQAGGLGWWFVLVLAARSKPGKRAPWHGILTPQPTSTRRRLF
jgi:hypothetical protein